MKKLNATVIDSRSGYIIDNNDIILHSEKNKNSGERLLLIGQNDEAKAMIKFKVDEHGNVSDFEVLEIIQSGNGLTISKDDN